MDFYFHKSFSHDCLQKHKQGSKHEIINKQDLSKQTKIASFYFDKENQQFILGLSNGQILQIIGQQINEDNNNILFSRSYDYLINKNNSSKHKGEIKCINQIQTQNSKYLITGSVDNTIKIWDYQNTKINCIQTLTGHNGTVLDIQYSQQLDTIFSCSLDKTIKIWKQSKERQMMFHPWFVQVQQIYNFSPKLLQENKSFIASLLLKKTEHVLTLYSGDSEGSIHILKPQQSWKQNTDFILEKTNYAFHRLLIIQILAIEKENNVFTIGYDQKIQGFDDMSGKKIYNFKNPSKCLFTCIQWDYIHQELVASDEQGNMYFISPLSDKSVQTFNLYKQKILKFEIMDQDSQQEQKNKKNEDIQYFTIILEKQIDIIKVRRGVKKGYILDEHTQTIIGLQSIQMKQEQEDDDRVYQSRIISCSLDNTIKVWDAKSMSCNQTINNNSNYEFASFIYLPYNNIFCTGHEKGIVKMWNLDTQNSIQLDYKNNNNKHTDFICSLANGKIVKKMQNYEEIYEYLFASGYDGRISVWEISEDNATSHSIISPQLKTIVFTDTENSKNPLGNEILALCFYQSQSQDVPNQIISGGNKNVIYIHQFDQDNKKQNMNLYPFQYLEGHTDSVNVLRLDENFLFSGSDDKTIIQWDVTQYFKLAQIELEHTRPIKDIMIIQQFIISCAFDGKINIYDYLNQQKVEGFFKNENFRVMAYLQKEKQLFVGTEDKNIFCFDMGRVFQDLSLDDNQMYDQMNEIQDQDEIFSGDTDQFD